jgi:hypothetical protein
MAESTPEQPTYAPGAKTQCAMCGIPASMRCAACKSVVYCKAEHQREHWKNHKKECQLLRAEAMTVGDGANGCVLVIASSQDNDRVSAVSSAFQSAQVHR